jgi:transcriptional regulator with XRE-family HTH domain
MSQEQLALAASADRSHIGRIERGENEITVLLLLRIAGALETSLAEMMTEAKL